MKGKEICCTMEWQVEEKGDTDKMPHQKLYSFVKASFFSLFNKFICNPSMYWSNY